MLNSSFVKDFLNDVTVPSFALVEQTFPDNAITDVEAAVRQALTTLQPKDLQGKEIALTVGSREINNIAAAIKTLVSYLKEQGAHPFILPAMGSHGSAIAEKQVEIIQDLGVTQEAVGAPIRATMDVVLNGHTPAGIPVYTNRIAAQADGIVVIGRIKPHTSFRGEIESGVMKMMTIGLGCQKGASTIHKSGIRHMSENIIQSAELVMKKQKILFGVGLVENAFDKLETVACLEPETLRQEEAKLLLHAHSLMPRILLPNLDVLIVDQMGKNISGAGMDPNITMKNAPETGIISPDEPERLVVLGLSQQSHGGATGMGVADIISRRLLDAVDYEKTYVNNFTAGMLQGCSTPVTLDSDYDAIRTAIKVLHYGDVENPRMVRIKDTLHLSRILISSALLPEAMAHAHINIIQEHYPLHFDETGALVDYATTF